MIRRRYCACQLQLQFGLFALIPAKKRQELTSGVPFGSKNSSGTIFCIFALLSSDGGEGLALYSVSAKLAMDGVLCGVRGVEVPLVVPFMPLMPLVPSIPFIS